VNREYLFPKTFEDARTRPIRQELEEVKQIATRQNQPKALTPDQYYGDPNRSGGGPSTYTGAKYSGALGKGFVSTWAVDRVLVLERSRRAYWESPQARKLVHRIADFAIGNGLSYQSSPVWELIDGMADPSEAKKKARAKLKRDLDLRFHMSASSHEFDAADRETLYEMEWNEIRDRLVDGETFTVLRYSDDPMRMNPVSLQRYRPDQVVSPMDAAATEAARAAGNTIFSGIEIDAAGREVAIWIRPDDQQIWNADSNMDRPFPTFTQQPIRFPCVSPSGRRFVIHAKLPGPPGEIRGVSILAPYLHELQKLDDARIAELEAMVLNAMLAWWVQPGPDVGSSDILKRLKAKSSGNSDGGVTQNGSTMTSGKPGITAPPLGPGEQLKSFDTARPNLDVNEFSRGIEGGIDASEGMAPEMVDIKYDTAYTAARGAILTTWTRIEIYRDMTASQWLGFILEAWFVQEIYASRVKAKGFDASPLIRRAWLNCTWLGTNMPSVNPLQEVQAVELRTKLGHTTGKREAMKYNNSDIGDNLSVLKDENECLAEARAPIVELENGQMTLGLDAPAPEKDPRSDPNSPQFDPNFDPNAPEKALRNVTPIKKGTA